MTERRGSMGDKVYRGDVVKYIRTNISLGTFMKRTIKTADEACWDLCYKLNFVPAIKEEPEMQTGKWISCKERLPEDGIYIVYAPYYTGGSSSAKECHNGIMFSKIKNGKWSIEHGYHKRPGCVWAWMPLPEPYQEGEQNG